MLNLSAVHGYVTLIKLGTQCVIVGEITTCMWQGRGMHTPVVVIGLCGGYRINWLPLTVRLLGSCNCARGHNRMQLYTTFIGCTISRDQ